MKKTKEKKQIRRVIAWCLYVLVLLAIIVTYTNSRYLSIASGNVDAEIAKAIVEIVNVTATMPIEANSIQKEINFEVRNKNAENEINDVNFLYQLQIETSDIPIEYTLYKVNSGTRSVVAIKNGKSEEFSLQHTINQTDSFVLVFKVSNKAYQDQTDDISISITARQVID